MSRDRTRAAAEALALTMLANQRAWAGATELAAANGSDWRSVARALGRLAKRGAVQTRQTHMTDDKYRKKVRNEYRAAAEAPMLVSLCKFDPSKLNIVGIRVIRAEW